MRPHTAACLTALALLAGAGCAGSGRRDNTAGAAPLDTIHIKSGDTLPPANGAGAIDTTPPDSAKRSGADSVR